MKAIERIDSSHLFVNVSTAELARGLAGSWRTGTVSPTSAVTKLP
nr:hypothetical protein [Burkholderia cepacia]